MNIKEYRAHIEILARSESELIFKNTNRQHASIVLANLIRTSKRSVVIYDDNISGDIADAEPDLRAAIYDFLEYGDGERNLTIYYKHNSSEIEFKKYLLKLHEDYPGLLNVQKVPQEKVKKVAKALNGDVNFAVGDHNKFRLESSSENGREAFCSFNNLKYPKKLLEAIQ